MRIPPRSHWRHNRGSWGYGLVGGPRVDGGETGRQATGTKSANPLDGQHRDGVDKTAPVDIRAAKYGGQQLPVHEGIGRVQTCKPRASLN